MPFLGRSSLSILEYEASGSKSGSKSGSWLAVITSGLGVGMISRTGWYMHSVFYVNFQTEVGCSLRFN